MQAQTVFISEVNEFSPSTDLTESFRKKYNYSIGVFGWLLRLSISAQESSEMLTLSIPGALSGFVEIIERVGLDTESVEIAGNFHEMLVGAVATRLGRPSFSERLEIARSLISEFVQYLNHNRLELEVDGAVFYAEHDRFFLRILPVLIKVRMFLRKQKAEKLKREKLCT